MPSQDGEPVPLMTAREWAESHRRLPSLPPPVLRRIAGPGWLDDDTPCACSRAFLMHARAVVSSHLVEQLISRPLYSGGVCTFDPRDLSTKVQK